MRLEEIEKLCTAIDSFDAEATAEACQREQEWPSCLSCGGEYRVDNGLIPTALDDGCAHDALTDLARFVIAVLPVVRAAESFLPQPDKRVDYVDRKSTDWGCADCVPDGDMVVARRNRGEPDFYCGPHALIRAFTKMRQELERGK